MIPYRPASTRRRPFPRRSDAKRQYSAGAGWGGSPVRPARAPRPVGTWIPASNPGGWPPTERCPGPGSPGHFLPDAVFGFPDRDAVPALRPGSRPDAGRTGAAEIDRQPLGIESVVGPVLGRAVRIPIRYRCTVIAGAAIRRPRRGAGRCRGWPRPFPARPGGQRPFQGVMERLGRP